MSSVLDGAEVVMESGAEVQPELGGASGASEAAEAAEAADASDASDAAEAAEAADASDAAEAADALEASEEASTPLPAPLPAPHGTYRSGVVALIGLPNVGKSTLLNQLLGTKLAIVTPKPQTTRTHIHGVLHRPDGQLVFVDTPGMCALDTPLKRAMRRVAGQAAGHADVVLVLTNLPGMNKRRPGRGAERTERATAPTTQPKLSDEDLGVLTEARRGGAKIVVGINKADLVQPKELLLPYMQLYASQPDVVAVVPMSARRGMNIDPLVDELMGLVEEGPMLYPPEMYTDATERALCGELVREQMLFKLRQEVPHSAMVVIDDFEDARGDEEGSGICRISGRVIVERETQKGIVLGKGGTQMKAISQTARTEMEALLGSKVYLRMQVVVDPDWTRQPDAVARYGFGSYG